MWTMIAVDGGFYFSFKTGFRLKSKWKLHTFIPTCSALSDLTGSIRSADID